METYVRGFSFMPTDKVEVVDIQDALERTWRNTRRERLKQREQKIWEEFVKESDIVSTVCEDDQYQFLDELPEACVKDIMESELLKIKTEKQADEPTTKLQEIIPGTEQQTIIDSLESDLEECDIFHIYDDDKDEQYAVESGALNDSACTSPPTVRENHPDSTDPPEEGPLDRPSSGSNTMSTCKSSENFTNVIESSIYCAKVKDLRIKINEEVLDMVSLLDRRDLFAMEKEDITRMIKRSAEFCSRFNRIYMYQLQRQMQDIKRNNNLTLPFAKHTQFQSQMVRIVSLHQNMLQSFQVFRKSMEQTCCVRESVSALGALVGAARAATEQCAGVTHPKDLSAAQQLYDDNLLSSCDKLEQFVNEYAVRCEEFLMGYANMLNGHTKSKSKEPKKTKKRQLLNLKNNSKNTSEADARLSMYSLGTVPFNTRSSTRDMQIGTNKSRCTLNSTLNDGKSSPDKPETPRKRKSPRRKSPKSRRPLMRDPHEGKPRVPKAARALRDDIPTMVEGVTACASNHMLNEEPTPPRPPRRSKGIRKEDSVRKSPQGSPRKHKSSNIKPIQGFIQTISQEPNLAKPTFRIRPSFKNSSKGEKKNEEDSKNEAEKENDADGEIDRTSTESINPDSATNDLEKLKSTKPEMVKLEPVKSVMVRPIAVKLKSTAHCEPLNLPPVSQESLRPEVLPSPKSAKSNKQNSVEEKKDRNKKSMRSGDRCEVTRLLQQLCSGDTTGIQIERTTTGVKNAQLLCINGTSSRSQPSTPQLLRILEETIQKKVPKSLLKKSGTRDVEKYRLNFNIADSVSENMFQYRTKFVQHMLTSPMYANSSVGKPWEMIGSVSEQIIDELLVSCVQDMELHDYISELYKQETC